MNPATHLQPPLDIIDMAKEYDSTIRLPRKDKPALLRKYIKSHAYSKDILFDNMANARISLFHDYPMSGNQNYNSDKLDILIGNLRNGLPRSKSIYISAGKSRSRSKVTIDQVIDKWVAQRSLFGVTDLHFRGTKFYKLVDAESLSYFNMLPACPPGVSFLEMMTLVLSSRGIFSDSHSDDGDGSNHCFVGKKLWFAWDRQEGRKAGLQDCTHDAVYDQAAFDIEAFTSLRSSRWFTVSENETLFLPGNMSHKVITLEPYIGFGSFYVSIPGYVNTLKRWILQETTDVKGTFLEELNDSVCKKISLLTRAPRETQADEGLDHLKNAHRSWDKQLNRDDKSRLMAHPVFTSFIRTADRLMAAK